MFRTRSQARPFRVHDTCATRRQDGGISPSRSFGFPVLLARTFAWSEGDCKVMFYDLLEPMSANLEVSRSKVAAPLFWPIIDFTGLTCARNFIGSEAQRRRARYRDEFVYALKLFLDFLLRFCRTAWCWREKGHSFGGHEEKRMKRHIVMGQVFNTSGFNVGLTHGTIGVDALPSRATRQEKTHSSSDTLCHG